MTFSPAMLTLMRFATFVLIPAMALAASAAAEAPLPRHGHRMVYNASREAVVMFGGRTHGKKYLGDTWSWDGETWTQVAAVGPEPRAWFGLAYDELREVLVLFGGRDASGKPRADTWEWRGTEWTLATEFGPEPRDHHGMVYDPARDRVVLQGGYNGTVSFEDTWEWDGREWSRGSSEGPGERDAHQLVYDSAGSRVVLFGGMYLDDGKAVVLADTWAWEGECKQLHAGDENGRSHYSMSADPSCDCLLRFGGGDPERVPRAGTWSFREGKWNELDVDSPTIRVDHDMVLNRSRNKVVLFGGYIPTPGGEIFGDTWEWDGEVWRRQ